MTSKYYIQLSNTNKIVQPYSDFGGFVPPSTAIEVPFDLINDYLNEKNKGLNVYYNDGVLSTVDPQDEPEYILAQKASHIKRLLSDTDTTQLLDNRLTEAKTLEFATYRQQLRDIIRDINDGVYTDIGDIVIPDIPSYN